MSAAWFAWRVSLCEGRCAAKGLRRAAQQVFRIGGGLGFC